MPLSQSMHQQEESSMSGDNVSRSGIFNFTLSSLPSMGDYCGELEIHHVEGASQNMELTGNDLHIIPLYNKSRISIGRSPLSSLVLSKFTVSNIHCLIWVVLFDEQSVPLVYLKDVSRNGTWLNDKKMIKNQVVFLNHADTISIPDVLEMEFRTMYGNAEQDRCMDMIQELSIKSTIRPWHLMHRLLGNGTFGHVFACENDKNPGTLYAVKVVKNDPTNIPFEARSLLSSLSHPNIIKVHHTCTFGDHLYIFEDLICGGDLFSYLSNGATIQAIPEYNAIVITYQIMMALEFLHKNNIVHRDLKVQQLENVLLETPFPLSRVILADFGIAKSISSTKRRVFTTVGTPEYSAPEVGFDIPKLPPHMRFSAQNQNIRLLRAGYDYKCDIWSLGIIVHIMLSGVSPFFEDGHEVNIVRAAKEGVLDLNSPHWDGVSVHAREFVGKVLLVDVNKRLDIQECFAHTWIAHYPELAGTYRKITMGT
ncbi:CYFA0S01e14048g1_1 [Cyberlindnera fabianii]|uniref:CYFA0S01e14048g1_1 n=1 Tax=Cyberlindnera fabianii TaxID=36022 RepID=A0A061AJC0_CYBFA|nr:CYFA0S01e14048g1_1 [Cyberlindnera fabianii]